ncbi:MAG: hypothetical protein ACRDH2_01145 [Anaerolineales bacterium]
MSQEAQLTFSQSVGKMVDRAAAQLKLPPALVEQIRDCYAVYDDGPRNGLSSAVYRLLSFMRPGWIWD